jgi:hypothetical protein
MTCEFKFPFPTTVTKVWNGGGVAAAATGGVTSGTALAANAAATGGGGGGGGGSLPFNPLDPNAMSGALAAAFQQQADALLAEVRKQTITIVCAIVFGTLGGLALLGGVSGTREGLMAAAVVPLSPAQEPARARRQCPRRQCADACPARLGERCGRGGEEPPAGVDKK